MVSREEEPPHTSHQREREREIWVGDERKIERQGGREKDRNRDKLGKKEGERGRLEVKERKIERETEAGERERERVKH